MNRWVKPIALLMGIVVIAIGVLNYMGTFKPGAEFVVTSVSGEVTFRNEGGEVQDIVAGATRVGESETITTGNDGTIVMKLGEGIELAVDSSASIRVGSLTDSGVEIELDSGRVKAEVRSGGPTLAVGKGDRKFKASESVFEVSADDEHTAVRVRTGTVTATGVDTVTEIGAGQSVAVMPNGQASISDIPKDLLLEVDWPEENRTRFTKALLKGKTDPGSLVHVLGVREAVEVRAGKDGRFEVQVELNEGLQTVRVAAKSLFGEEIAAQWDVELDTTGPSIRGEVLATP